MKIISAFLWNAALVCIFFSCTKDDRLAGEEDPTAEQKPDMTYNVNTLVMLGLINEVRGKGCNCGTTVMPAVPALAWNELLAKVAYDHSNDMKANGYFSHTGRDNRSPGERMKSAGYNWRTYGENIAMGQTTEQIVMKSWLNSEGHCKNIMNRNFKETGVGRAGNYWTQVFGAR